MAVDPNVILGTFVDLPLTLGLYAVTDGGERVEVSGGAYQPHTASPFAWAVADGVAETVWTFRFAGAAGLVHGYFLRTPNGDVLDYCEFGDGPKDVQVVGSAIEVMARLVA